MHETDAIRNSDDHHYGSMIHIQTNADRNSETYHELTPYSFSGEWFQTNADRN